LGPANSQDGGKFKEHNHRYQHLSCTSPSLQLQNSQLVKKLTWQTEK